MKKYLTSLAKAGGIVLILASNCLPVYAANDGTNLHQNEGQYTAVQEAIIEQIPEMEQKYLEEGLNRPLKADRKGSPFRAATGAWSWRDGVICVTTEGLQIGPFNTWHAAIVAPQYVESVVEAPRAGEVVRFRHGMWSSPNHTIWQVGVNSTTVQQDWNAGHWAGQQKGKPYNTYFWESRQTNSFYCSQLVWAAYYYTAGVDLNKPDNDIPGKIMIHPGEFVTNNKTTVMYRNR